MQFTFPNSSEEAYRQIEVRARAEKRSLAETCLHMLRELMTENEIYNRKEREQNLGPGDAERSEQIKKYMNRLDSHASKLVKADPIGLQRFRESLPGIQKEKSAGSKGDTNADSTAPSDSTRQASESSMRGNSSEITEVKGSAQEVTTEEVAILDIDHETSNILELVQKDLDTLERCAGPDSRQTVDPMCREVATNSTDTIRKLLLQETGGGYRGATEASIHGE